MNINYVEFLKQHENANTTFVFVRTMKTTNSGLFSYKESDHHSYISIEGGEDEFFNKVKTLSAHGGDYVFKIPESRDDVDDIIQLKELSKVSQHFKFVRMPAIFKFAVFFSCDGDFSDAKEVLLSMYPDDGENIKYNKSLKNVIKAKKSFTFSFAEMSFMFNDPVFIDTLPFFLAQPNINLHKIHIQVENSQEAERYVKALT